jgi:lipopolysaccharide/colanic/teichoic acid biosynthesis glycosyltransferase
VKFQATVIVSIEMAGPNIMEQKIGVGEMESSGCGLPLWKRALDLSCIALLSPGWLLVGLFVALVIKAGSRGPIFFRQQRVGFKGRQFTCFKFRTMKLDAEIDSHRRYTQQLIKSQTPMRKLDEKRDPRLVPLGALLRATGLDELPQLLNILRGEMSLVGPRPCIPYECEAYEHWHWGRFDAVPGLTGLWQVSGKNRTTFEQMVQLDIQYARTMTLWLDLCILLKTIPAVWGQYSDLQAAKSVDACPPRRGFSKSVQTY